LLRWPPDHGFFVALVCLFLTCSSHLPMGHFRGCDSKC
jgi:hypothetical protein